MTPTVVPVKPVETSKAATTPAEIQKLAAENQLKGTKSAENKKMTAETYRKCAKDHEAAAKHYEMAAKYFEEGNAAKASDVAKKAEECMCSTTDARNETAKQPALKN